MKPPYHVAMRVGLLKVGVVKLGKLGFSYRLYEDRIAISSQGEDRRLTWEELQRIKTEVIGDVVCIEVYPKSNEVVNSRHTRHLWFSKDIDKLVYNACSHPEFSK